ncbi:MAG: arylsulfatase [Planctomycetes bacterium]|nr:arylsulfatase [Planctomycetota bacterium]
MHPSAPGLRPFALTVPLLLTACGAPSPKQAAGATGGTVDRTVLPIREPARPRYTELDVRKATPPPRFVVEAPTGAPNVIVILIDDMGFGTADAFGGPVPMPTLARLGQQGLKFNRFHTTAVCAPTRAAILTGYNHHSNNMGSITETATSFPGMNSVRPQTITPVAEVLRQNGFNTGFFGKCHEVPAWEISPVGPQDRWPTRSGFEKFYGFLGGETNQWAPTVYDGVTVVEPPHDPDYHFTTDMTDQAVAWMNFQQALAPDRPFFMYYAPGATHAPHHVPKAWVEKFKGQFDQGWDALREQTLARQIRLGVVPKGTKLAPKPAFIPDWNTLSPDEQRLFTRQMEVYAGFAAHTDHEVGRLVTALEKMGELERTMIIYIAGDNGASAEGQRNGMFSEMTYFNAVPEKVEDMLRHLDEWGGPSTYPHMSAGWAVALDAPFAYTKQVGSDYGGTRNGMVVHWPAGTRARGEIRSQFTHVIDVAPTIYEVTGVPAPRSVNGIEQDPIEGTSFAYAFHDAQAPERHTVQYFEMFGNRAIYQDGWLARTIHRPAWDAKPLRSLQEDVWDLFDERSDFSLANNLAAQHPDKLAAMQALFLREAERYHVLPIDDRVLERTNAAAVGRPTVMEGRNSMTLHQGMTAMGVDIFIDLRNKAYTIRAEVEVGEDAQGVLVCQGGRFGGLSFYVKDGRPAFTYNFLGLESTTIAATEKLAAGKRELVYEFTYEGPGMGKGGVGRIQVDGQQVAEGRLKRTQPGIFSVDDLADVGVDLGTPVADYGASSRFNGQIQAITIEVKR